MGMVRQHVAYLVSDDRGKLALVLGYVQQPRIDADLAPRQGEGIGL